MQFARRVLPPSFLCIQKNHEESHESQPVIFINQDCGHQWIEEETSSIEYSGFKIISDYWPLASQVTSLPPLETFFTQLILNPLVAPSSITAIIFCPLDLPSASRRWYFPL